jgi:hypothetical protein
VHGPFVAGLQHGLLELRWPAQQQAPAACGAGPLLQARLVRPCSRHLVWGGHRAPICRPSGTCRLPCRATANRIQQTASPVAWRSQTRRNSPEISVSGVSAAAGHPPYLVPPGLSGDGTGVVRAERSHSAQPKER